MSQNHQQQQQSVADQYDFIEHVEPSTPEEALERIVLELRKEQMGPVVDVCARVVAEDSVGLNAVPELRHYREVGSALLVHAKKVSEEIKPVLKELRKRRKWDDGVLDLVASDPYILKAFKRAGYVTDEDDDEPVSARLRSSDCKPSGEAAAVAGAAVGAATQAGKK